jgi:serine phosphatase RsbU (regulator of sigma subunit)/ketosteroid isomerase-like protein
MNLWTPRWNTCESGRSMVWIVIATAALATLVALLATLISRERRARRRFQILADVAAVSDADRSLGETFEAICDTLVPELADFCMIDVLEDGEPKRLAVKVAPRGGSEIERGLAERLPSLPRWMVDKAGAAALEPRFQERVGERELRELAHDDGRDLEFLRSIGMRSTITVALKARGEVTGTLTLGLAWSGRRYRRGDVRFAWVLSGRVALALDNSGLFADLENAEHARAQIAETLQRGLLPPPLPHVPGWSIAAMYRPAGAENEVGGDFYDIFRLRGGWMLAIGDVTGRGAHAASVTAVARYTLRTAFDLADDPGVALETLNRALLARGGDALCSLAAVALSEDPAQPIRVAVAGHPPPLLVDGDTVSEATSTGPVLGAFPDAVWSVVETEIAPGQQLAILTDGVAESRGPRGRRFGEEQIRDELLGVGNPSLALQRLEGSLQAFTGGALNDDVAVLAIARAAGAPPSSAPPAQVELLYECFNRRDQAGIEAICDDRMEFYPVATAEAVGREAPYIGPAGLRAYMADVATVWEELQIRPSEIERRGDTLLVRGRVYARSHERGIRDIPAAWVWEARGGRFVRGEVFPDPDQAAERFASVAA